MRSRRGSTATRVGFCFARIRRSIRGEITLIAIGPLFNEQAAIERDPATFRKLKRVVIMGGSVYRGYDGGNPANGTQPPSAEWNILLRPGGSCGRCWPRAFRFS